MKWINQDGKEKQQMCSLICQAYSLTIERVYPGQINVGKGQEKNKRVRDIAQESL